MKKESVIQREIQRACNTAGSGRRVFRNNVGHAVDQKGHHIRFGVGGRGGSDLIGWTQKTITPEDVGSTVAIFTAIEVKSQNGKATAEQQRFIDAVNNSGGIGMIARVVDDVE